MGQMAGGGSVKWPAIDRPNDRRSFGQMAAACWAKGAVKGGQMADDSLAKWP
jgi:hypothetical protein